MEKTNLLEKTDVAEETIGKKQLTAYIVDHFVNAGYNVVETNDEKPWGAYIRIHNDQAEDFIEEFFPGLSPEEAHLGIEGVELSPKILIVQPGQRLSWQLHHRRAERWRFLTAGAYHKSMNDDEGNLVRAQPGDVVQFSTGERHRLVGQDNNKYTFVAEIWQHTDPEQLSDENDIVRIQDDYAR